MLPAQVVEHIIKLAVDPREVELTVEVGHANFILHGKPMTRGASKNEPLRIKFGSLKWRGRAVWASHQRHIQLALRQQIAELVWHALQQRDLNSRVVRPEAAQKADELHRGDSTHDAD